MGVSESGWVVNGDVDIVAKVDDTVSPKTGNVGIYRIKYEIKELTGDRTHNVPPTELRRFDSLPKLIPNLEAEIVYKNQPPMDSDPNYAKEERYYYIVTNLNGGVLDETN